MKVFTFMTAVALALSLGAASASAQDSSEGCDLRIWQVLSPNASPLTNQPVSFTVWNNGAPVSHFKAGVIMDGNVVCEKEVDATVETESTYTVNLGYNVECPYGQTTSMKLFVHADGDTDPTNDETDWNVDMPRLLDYPYTWSDETSKSDFTYGQFWGMGWGYDEENYKAFYMTGKATNWMGDLATLPVNFPADGKVACSFDYGTSGGKVGLDVVLDYGDSKDTLQTVELGESTQGFSPGFFSFTARKPAIVSISAKLEGEWNAYGSVYLRNFCFKDAVKDMAASKILSPELKSMAVSDEPVPVKVRYRNVSPFDIVNPVFAYEAGSQKVVETYNGTVKGGETVDYLFAQGLAAGTPGTVSLKAWCQADGDENKDNDEVEASVDFYEPLGFPYTTAFDDGGDRWTAIDGNADGSTWGVSRLTDGNNVAAFTNSQATFDDQYVSPAIAIQAGRSRVSFYYAGVNRAGTARLRLYMSDRPTAENAELLFDKNISNGGWLNGYHLLDMKAQGTKYFIFDLTGTGDQIVIDNFKVDADEDLCINNTTFDTKSGYNKKSAKVTISYVNHGLSPQGNIDVRYYINDFDHYVQETVTDAVQPGDTLYYTFDKEADISATDSTYLLVGQIVTKVGSDTQNDMAYGDAIENYRVESVPYYYAFNDESRNGHWLIANGSNPNSGWSVEDFWYAYDGTADLVHKNYMGDDSDDWAYSECVHLTPGKYDVSMFYRGRTYFSGDEYNQSFEVRMGTDTTPEAMTIEVGRSDNEDVYQPAFRKLCKVVDIATEGDYFIGFHSTSAANQGETHIDAVSVSPVKDGLQLPFESDFAGKAGDWTWYNENATQFTKWTVDDGKAVVSRTEDDSYNYFEGLLVTPKLALTPGKPVRVDVAYGVDTDDESLTLQLYGGTVNNPADMHPLAELPAKDGKYTFEFTPSDGETEYYLGFRSNTDPDDQDQYVYGPFYRIELSSVSVSYANATGIDDVADARGVAVAVHNGAVTVSAAGGIREASLYDAAGRAIAAARVNGRSATMSCGGYRGVAVLKATTASGATVVRTLTL